MRRFDDDEVCFVCRRRACGLAIGGQRLGWLCDDCADGLYGVRAYAMSGRRFDEYEQRALLRAGDEAGAYLDKISKTDLAELSGDDWRAFLGLIVTAFGAAIREEVGRGITGGWINGPIATDETAAEDDD